MTNLFLLRHGRSSANSKGILAGRAPGVHLDATGEKQAQQVAERLRDIRFAALVSSPLERCQETIAPVAAGRRRKVKLDERFIEAHYGSWTGKKLSALAKDPLWPTVQVHPSAVRFPGRAGESMMGMASRAIDGVRAVNASLKSGDSWLLCSHGDIIKAILADALGMHLDDFQRINVDPASISVIRYTPMRPFVQVMNSTSGDLAEYAATDGGTDAVVGGSTGTTRRGNTARGRRRSTAG
ncbi:MSMEG_4193 family putative phosphomutase [Epidermidibacterium keratini]|uniref:MSMEG_4193 family putative phosphomutase n=1 Tax=Epidermidibacterium keratini TaxID=1891644 RepID=A0A7L4YTG9_9ACTN|nr:MSMEG_4193 family putative phosphomutase [Epidermidibacterium keratini]QHC02069.1 MSMEG_4193 family putative phosphomutase [Epidermidibacterium keratini]